MRKIISLAVFAPLILLSCTKEKEEFSLDGKLEKRYHYYESDNGSIIKHGKYQSWYSNQITEYIGEYRDNKKHGHWMHWNSKNAMVSESHYEDGLLNGLKTEYIFDGKKHAEIEFSKGKRNGKTIVYFATNDKITNESYYSNGIPTGQWKAFDENKDLIYTLNFENGVPKEIIGKWKINGLRKSFFEFDKKGQLKHTFPMFAHPLGKDPLNEIKYSYELIDRGLVLYNQNGVKSETYYIDGVNQSKIRLTQFSNSKFKEIILTRVN